MSSSSPINLLPFVQKKITNVFVRNGNLSFVYFKRHAMRLAGQKMAFTRQELEKLCNDGCFCLLPSDLQVLWEVGLLYTSQFRQPNSIPQNNVVDLLSVLSMVRAPLSDLRRKVVEDVFRGLQEAVTGGIRCCDLHNYFKSLCHPDCVSGKRSASDVFREFEELSSGLKENKNIMTCSDFEELYADLSVTISDDATFSLILFSCWPSSTIASARAHRATMNELKSIGTERVSFSIFRSDRQSSISRVFNSSSHCLYKHSDLSLLGSMEVPEAAVALRSHLLSHSPFGVAIFAACLRQQDTTASGELDYSGFRTAIQHACMILKETNGSVNAVSTRSHVGAARDTDNVSISEEDIRAVYDGLVQFLYRSVSTTGVAPSGSSSTTIPCSLGSYLAPQPLDATVVTTLPFNPSSGSTQRVNVRRDTSPDYQSHVFRYMDMKNAAEMEYMKGRCRGLSIELVHFLLRRRLPKTAWIAVADLFLSLEYGHYTSLFSPDHGRSTNSLTLATGQYTAYEYTTTSRLHYSSYSNITSQSHDPSIWRPGAPVLTVGANGAGALEWEDGSGLVPLDQVATSISLRALAGGAGLDYEAKEKCLEEQFTFALNQWAFYNATRGKSPQFQLQADHSVNLVYNSVFAVANNNMKGRDVGHLDVAPFLISFPFFEIFNESIVTGESSSAANALFQLWGGGRKQRARPGVTSGRTTSAFIVGASQSNDSNVTTPTVSLLGASDVVHAVHLSPPGSLEGRNTSDISVENVVRIIQSVLRVRGLRSATKLLRMIQDRLSHYNHRFGLNGSNSAPLILPHSELPAISIVSVIRNLGIPIPPSAVYALLASLSPTGKGYLDAGSRSSPLLTENDLVNVYSLDRVLFPLLSGARAEAVRTAFAKLISSSNGGVGGAGMYLDINFVRSSYLVSKHPDVVNSRRQAEDVRQEFFDCCDGPGIVINNPISGFVSNAIDYNGFLNFYRILSVLIEDENIFLHIIFSTWGLFKELPKHFH